MPTQLDPSTPDGFIGVRATSSVAVTADRAELTVTFRSCAPTRPRVARTARTCQGRLTRVLTLFDSTVGHIHTLDSAVTDSGVVEDPARWQIATSTQIDIDDLSRLSALQLALTKLRPENLSAATFSVNKAHSAWDAIRRDAVREAHTRAKLLADAGGAAILGIDHLTDVDSTHCPHTTIAQTGSSPISLEPPTLRLTVTVNARYRIRNPAV